MQAISIIRSEHRNLGAVLYSLEQLLTRIDAGKHPDFAVFHGLLTYIDRFLNRFHHPKEDLYLFPRLLERSPASAELIDRLERQHREGEALFVNLLKALSAYEFCGDGEFSDFRSSLLAYTTFEREHALLEENELLPMAQDSLQAADWMEIDAAFSANRDPMFGEQAQDEFSALLQNLVNSLPAPLGLGDSWK